MANVIDSVLTWWSVARADTPALRTGDDIVTYRELRGWSIRIAAYLCAHGVVAGDRVSIQAANSITYVAAMLGAIRIGAIAAPLNSRLRPREVIERLDVLEPTLFFVDEDARLGLVDQPDIREGPLTLDVLTRLRTGDAADCPAHADPDAVVGIISTSGSTDKPKGVMYSNRSMLTYTAEVMMQEPWCGEGAKAIVYPPLSTSAGFVPTMELLILGGTTYLESRFDPDDALALIEREEINVLQASTIFYERMAAAASFPTAKVSSLKLTVTGGAPVSVDLLRQWIAKGAVIRQLYGQTESGGTSTVLSAEEAALHPDKCGRGGPLTDIAIHRPDGSVAAPGEPGEIWIRGPGIMVGYWNAPEATAATLQNGWLRTGDQGVVDETGNLTFVDRLKDIIISGGFNISAAEIERVIAELPNVEDVAVIAAKDDRFGETPMAVVHASAGISVAEIVDHCNDCLSNYKVPRYIVIEDAPLPRLPTGKIAKRDIRDKYQDAHLTLEKVR